MCAAAHVKGCLFLFLGGVMGSSEYFCQYAKILWGFCGLFMEEVMKTVEGVFLPIPL